MNQADIISGLKKGDNNIFSEVVLAWQNKVYNTAIGIVQNEQDAEDITQEVFVTLYEKINDFREEAALSSWIYRITLTRSLDHEKRKNRQKRGGLLKQLFVTGGAGDPVDFNHPGILLDNKEKAALLFKSLKKIPKQQRIAFTLQKLEGLSNQEIALIMNNSVYAVESLQSRAKKNLKNILKHYYQE